MSKNIACAPNQAILSGVLAALASVLGKVTVFT
jgi:hypothetical protein